MWVFDTSDGCARLLKQRSGHIKPPNRLQFYDQTWLLSSSTDRSLRLSHIYRDQQHVEFSQGHIEKIAKKTKRDVQSLKLNPIRDFTTNTRRARRWSDIVSIHEQEAEAHLWRSDKKALSKKKLTPHDMKDYAVSVNLSQCGNFCLVGHNSGRVNIYNVQSGQHRFTIKKSS
eukprot:UN06574